MLNAEALASGNGRDGLGELAREVARRTRSPKDWLEVAAVLESMAWTDQEASERLGFGSVFELARAVYERLPPAGTESRVLETTPPLWRRLARSARQFLAGVVFAMPMVTSITAMLTIRYSLWSYQYFSTQYATAIAIGTAMSFVATGGFTQAIARRGLMYIGQKEYNLARRLSFRLVLVGVAATIVVGGAMFCLNWLFELFPWDMASLTFLYYFFLSAIWLSITVLYMLKKEILFTLVMLLGIGAVALLHEFFRLTMVMSQVIVLSMTGGLSLLMAARFFRVAELKRETGAEASPLPRSSLVVYTVAPYFAYGLLYFGFLYVDRLVSWSTTNAGYMPYAVWFRGQYELGLDWAILALIIPMGAIEMILNQFVDSLAYNERRFSGRQAAELGRHYVGMYARYLAEYFALSVCSGLFVRWAVVRVEALRKFEVYVTSSPESWLVFNLALVAYTFVAAGLLNAMIFFCLSRPEMAVRSMALGLGVDFAVGFVSSRLFGYEWAVVGLVAGSVVFAVTGSVQMLKVVRRLDYYYYASV